QNSFGLVARRCRAPDERMREGNEEEENVIQSEFATVGSSFISSRLFPTSHFTLLNASYLVHL
ncbi:hypothetical protein KAU32_07160, partial [bacterium]|nr:hypothetical protein [bacterium]